MTTLQEYDLEIKPANVLRGKGICNLAFEARYFQENSEGWENDASVNENEIYYILIHIDSWYYEIKDYLTHGSALEYWNLKK